MNTMSKHKKGKISAFNYFISTTSRADNDDTSTTSSYSSVLDDDVDDAVTSTTSPTTTTTRRENQEVQYVSKDAKQLPRETLKLKVQLSGQETKVFLCSFPLLSRWITYSGLICN